MVIHRLKGSGLKRRSAPGAAVVEMAVVAPVLLALLFGIIEFGWVFMAYQTITNAAREGARTASLQGSTDQDIEDRVNQYMEPARLPQYSLQVVTSIDGAGTGMSAQHYLASDNGRTETVIVSVPYADVTLLGLLPDGSFNLTATCSMAKEGI